MLGSLALYARNLSNWPAVSLARWRKDSLPALKLRGGHRLNLLDSHAEIWAFHSIYGEHCYERDFTPVPKDGTVIDLGANVGIFTVYAATRLVPKGRVLAVEASPPSFAKLRENLSSLKNVTAWDKAVGGSGDFWLTEDSLGASIFHAHDAVKKIRVEGITCESVLKHFPRVSLLKANMEGAEYPFVLDTADNLWDRLERAAIKWHHGDVSGSHHPDELRDKLTARGFRIRRHEYIWTEEHLRTGITTAER